MNISKPLQLLASLLQQGDLDNAKLMLVRHDIRIKKHFLFLLKAALNNSGLEPAQLIWDAFEKVSSINHLPIKIQAIQLIVQKPHAKMYKWLHPSAQNYLTYDQQYNLTCNALNLMDGELLSVCWQDIDFKRGRYNWSAFFEHPLCDQTVGSLVDEVKEDGLSGSFVILAHRFHHTDLVDSIFRKYHSPEIFRMAVGDGSELLIHQLLDHLNGNEENTYLHYARHNIRLQRNIELLERIAVQRQAQRICSEIDTVSQTNAKRKM